MHPMASSPEERRGWEHETMLSALRVRGRVGNPHPHPLMPEGHALSSLIPGLDFLFSEFCLSFPWYIHLFWWNPILVVS